MTLATIASGVDMIFHWEQSRIKFIALGICGYAGQFCMTKSFQVEVASKVSAWTNFNISQKQDYAFITYLFLI